MEKIELSKKNSRLLRHRPEAAGLVLDKSGWCGVDELIAGLARTGTVVTIDEIETVVRENDKQRFVMECGRIRAAQGHSVPGVEPVMRLKKPPSQLFHGTVEASLESILKKGLLPMRRHHVHLSVDVETARTVGSRRGKPAVLVVDAAGMEREGRQFFVADNGVWLTSWVPGKNLRLMRSD